MPTTNSLGTLAATGVFHDALGLVLKRLPVIARMASNIVPSAGYLQMPFNIAQTLKDYNATHTVSDRSTTGTYAKQAGLTIPADKTFTLNKWPYISFLLTAVELNQMIDSATKASARDSVITKIMTRAFNALGTQIVNDLIAVITAGNFSRTIVNAVGAMDYKKLGTMVDTFLQNDVLMEAPSALLEIVAFREFANSLTAVYNDAIVGEVVQSGVIAGGVSGANDISRYNITQNANADRGFLLDPQAILFANRIPIEEQLPNDPVFQTVITEPDTGFSVLLREAKDPLTGEVTRTITTLYGFGVGLEKHLLRITSV